MPYHFVKREKKDVKCDDPMTSHLSLFTSAGNTTYYDTFTNIIIVIKNTLSCAPFQQTMPRFMKHTFH